MNIDFQVLEKSGTRVYAGFRRRFLAIWIEILLILPLIYVAVVFRRHGLGIVGEVALLLVIPLVTWSYEVYFHARFGGTIGKLLLGIRVTRLSGEWIGWVEALKRSSVGIGLAMISMGIGVWAYLHVNPEQYTAAGLMEKNRMLASVAPNLRRNVEVVSQLWVRSEVLVMLFNERRRALHDYIAGTVVIYKEFRKQRVVSTDS